MTKFKDGKLFSIILFLTFTLGLYAPLEIYLTNVNEFWFSIYQICWMPLLVCIVIFFILYVLGLLIKKRVIMYKIYLAIIFGLGCCSYIQANFINLDVGIMNGAEIDWTLYTYRIYKDLIVWCVSIILVIIFFLWEEVFIRIAKFTAYFLTLVQLVTLITLLGKGVIGGDFNNKNRGTFNSDYALYEVGSEENIIVFMLDMFDDNYFKRILNSEPEIADQLDGFTYFNNYTGLYSATACACTSLFTGNVFHNEMYQTDWVETQAEKRIYLDEVVDAGYDLYFYSDHSSILPDRIETKLKNNFNVTIDIKNKIQFLEKLYQLAGCKYFPDYYKTVAWMDGSEFNAFRDYQSESKLYENGNKFFRNGLEEKGSVDVRDGAMEYKFIHTTGAHFPYYINSKGEDVEKNTVDAVNCARGSLQIVQNYMEMLKEQGIYDKSSIIIMADHGFYKDGVLSNPIFLVKPENSRGTMLVNNAPVSQQDYSATTVDLIGYGNKEDYGRSAFDVSENLDRKRLFYLYYLDEYIEKKLRLIEYQAPAISNNTTLFKLTDNEYSYTGEKIQHSKYCKTCQNGESEVIENGLEIHRHEKSENYPK